jgi:hypothetical protein
MFGAHPADGAERQTLEVHVLREILPRRIGIAPRRDARIADGKRADLARGRQIRLQ